MTILDQLPGATIRTNYRTGPYTVARVTVIGGLIGIATTTGQYLNDYVVEGERIVKARAWLPGSSGYLSNRGGLDGDGRDEVFIVADAPIPVAGASGKQLSLFEGM